tara:strand:+ start:522 stop:923 length:402 start_codon:yes stop_codon:yes gene_type:complete
MPSKLLQRVKDAVEAVTRKSPGILDKVSLPSKKSPPQEDEKVYITEDEYGIIVEALSESSKALEKIKTLAAQYEVLRAGLLVEVVGHDREGQEALKKLKELYHIPEEGPWSLQVPSADEPLAYFFYNEEDDNG